MTSHEFLATLQVNNGWEIESITSDSLIEDAVSWDSMAILGFLAAADKQLGVHVNADKVVAARTVGELLSLVATGISEIENKHQ